MKPILFVCLGNICRSPAAEAVFRRRARVAGLAVEADSAGTGAWHLGAPPHREMIAEGARRGYDLRPLRARQVVSGDFARFGMVLAMDRSVFSDLGQMPLPHGAALRMFLRDGGDVPDPWYTGDFARTLDCVEEGVAALLAEIRR